MNTLEMHFATITPACPRHKKITDDLINKLHHPRKPYRPKPAEISPTLNPITVCFTSFRGLGINSPDSDLVCKEPCRLCPCNRKDPKWELPGKVKIRIATRVTCECT